MANPDRTTVRGFKDFFHHVDKPMQVMVKRSEPDRQPHRSWPIWREAMCHSPLRSQRQVGMTRARAAAV